MGTLKVHIIQAGLGCTHLLEYDSGLVLVDAGSRGNERKILRCIRSLGRDDLRLIFITHAHLDHYGSAVALRRLTGAPIAIHRADAGAMRRAESPLGSVRGRGKLVLVLLHLFRTFLAPEPTPADILLDEGEDLSSFGLDAVVVHTPGHTPGSSSLLVEKRLAFVGDLLSTSGHPHVQRFYATDWSLIQASLARIQALKPEWVYTGHGFRPMSGKVLQGLRCDRV
jgi:glyoxylase-like metal-dependent hydrolase (beta-lactamase superfamily II)